MNTLEEILNSYDSRIISQFLIDNNPLFPFQDKELILSTSKVSGTYIVSLPDKTPVFMFSIAHPITRDLQYYSYKIVYTESSCVHTIQIGNKYVINFKLI